MQAKVMTVAVWLATGAIGVWAQGAGPDHPPMGRPGGPGGAATGEMRPGFGGMGDARGGMQEQRLMERIVNNPEVAKKLELTEAQQETLRKGFFDLQAQQAKLHADMQVAGIEQARLLTEKKVDEAAVMAAVEKTGALRTQLAKLNVRGLLLVRNTLTEEQREKMHAMVQQRMQRASEERKGRGPGERRFHGQPPAEDEGGPATPPEPAE